MSNAKINPKKSLGQHFLTGTGIIDSMISAADVQKEDFVLEIGPGKGILTKGLLATGARVIAVEKDNALIPVLQDIFQSEIKSQQLTLIHEDILESKSALDIPYKLVANIPYYITGQIIRMFFEAKNQPESMTLLVQKEVAERIVARDGKESLLSLSVKAYGAPKLIRTVSPGSFNPPPTVDSAILHIASISRINFKNKQEEIVFFRVLHLAFAHKRKQLFSNLSEAYSKPLLTEIFEKLGIDMKVRAEDLELRMWLQLSRSLTVITS